MKQVKEREFHRRQCMDMICIEGDIGSFRYCGIVLFFVRYSVNCAASVRYCVLSIQAVSVFIEFSMRYCGISRFFFSGIAVVQSLRQFPSNQSLRSTHVT